LADVDGRLLEILISRGQFSKPEHLVFGIMEDQDSRASAQMRQQVGKAILIGLNLLVCFKSEAQPVTNQSSVAQGVCGSGKNYWYQGRRLQDATLCTKFSFSQFFDIAIEWDPKWNVQAKKRYCPGSERDACFIP
jgi:hypothetical protein